MKKLLSVILFQFFVFGIIFAAKIDSKQGYAGLDWGSTVADAKKAGYKLTPITASDNLYLETVEAYRATSKDKNVSALQLHYYNDRLFFVSETLTSNDFTLQKLESRYGNFNKQGIYLAGKQYTDADRDSEGAVLSMSIIISNSTGSVTAKMYDWNVYKNISVAGRQTSQGQKSKTAKTAIGAKLEVMAEELADDLIEENGGSGKPSLAILPLTTDYRNVNVEDYVTEDLTEAMLSIGKVTVYERANLEKPLEELHFQETGYIDQNTAKQVGDYVGVDFVCYGTLKDSGDKLTVKARVVNVKTAEICAISSTVITKDDYLKAQPQRAVGATKSAATAAASSKTASSSVGVTNNAWKVVTRTNEFDNCTYYTFILNSSEKQFLFFNYKKAQNAGNSRVIAGIHWTEGEWFYSRGTYEIKGTNGKLFTKKLHGDANVKKSDESWNTGSFYYAYDYKDSARWLVEMMKNSDSVAVRRDEMTRRFQTAGLLDKMAEYDISWAELSNAIANEEF